MLRAMEIAEQGLRPRRAGLAAPQGHRGEAGLPALLYIVVLYISILYLYLSIIYLLISIYRETPAAYDRGHGSRAGTHNRNCSGNRWLISALPRKRLCQEQPYHQCGAAERRLWQWLHSLRLDDANCWGPFQ